MPAFLVPLHESNDCHNPDGPGGGQFCSGPGAGGPTKAKGKIRQLDDALSSSPPSAAHERQILGHEGAALEIATAMAEALPGEFDVRVMAGGGPRIRVFVKSPKIEVRRAFERQQGRLVALHANLELKPEMQKSGIAKDLMQAQLTAYATLGVDEIQLGANLDVGGYAWARYGFKARHPGEMAHLLRSRLNPRMTSRMAQSGIQRAALRLEPEHKQVLLDLINKHENDPKLPWVIADAHYNGVKIGKELLLGASWEGVMDLKDAEAVGRMTRYLRQ